MATIMGARVDRAFRLVTWSNDATYHAPFLETVVEQCSPRPHKLRIHQIASLD